MNVIIEIYSPSYVSLEDDGKKVECYMLISEVHTARFWFNVYETIICGVVLFLLYTLIIGSLIINRKKMTGATLVNSSMFNVEAKLMLCVLFHVILLAMDAGSTALVYLFNVMFDTMNALNFVVQDLLCSSNPYLLLIFSSQLRKKLFPYKISIIPRVQTISNNNLQNSNQQGNSTRSWT
ncbi:hypothetical protein L596_012652 [Steinernema carpocapsae]|uniref:Serpentine receptor class gamma n=1 Tax=Steinernema carpocapsae TaxID=34508 RepID=A0A4U5NXR2_STECR|nr:hypothetical protein L596_012652 [Steinernema carpocapsae]